MLDIAIFDAGIANVLLALIFYIALCIMYERSEGAALKDGFKDAALCNFMDGFISTRPVQAMRYTNCGIMLLFTIWYWWKHPAVIPATVVPVFTVFFAASKQYKPSGDEILTEDQFVGAIKLVGEFDGKYGKIELGMQ